MRQIAAEQGFYVDPRIASMLDGLASRLAKAAPTPPRIPIAFHTVDDGTPRLFSTLGGHVYVSRGLLAALASEDELAMALGHEAAHVLLGHAAELRGQSRAAGTFAVLGVIAAMSTGAFPIVPSFGVVGVNASQQGIPVDSDVPIYSAQQELAADALAQEICARAGFDPNALVRLFHTSTRLGWGDVSDDRLQESSRRAAALGVGSSKQSDVAAQEAYLTVLDGLPLQEAPTTELLSGSQWIDRKIGLTIHLPEVWHAVQGRGMLVVPDSHVDALQGICVRIDHFDRPHDPVIAATQYSRDHEVGQLLPTTVQGRNAHRVYSWNTSGLGFLDKSLSGCTAAAHALAGQAAADLTWIQWPPGLVRIAVVASFATTSGDTDLPETEKETLQSVAASARPVEPEDYAGVEFLRLRIAHPEPGESLREVVARAPTPWSVAEAAAVNDLPADQPLSANTPVKLAWTEPYVHP